VTIFLKNFKTHPGSVLSSSNMIASDFFLVLEQVWQTEGESMGKSGALGSCVNDSFLVKNYGATIEFKFRFQNCSKELYVLNRVHYKR